MNDAYLEPSRELVCAKLVVRAKSRLRRTPVLSSFSGFGDAERAADFPDQQIGDFVVTGNGFTTARGRIPMDGVRAAFAFERTAMRFQMANEFAPFHASSSTFTSPESLRRASSRRSSMSSKTASLRLCRHSSGERPCPLASGTSWQNPTYQSPSR